MKKFEELTLEELKALYEKAAEKEEDKASSNTRWRAEAEIGKYYYIDDFGEIGYTLEEGDDCDNFRYNTGNYFKTKEEAEEHKKKLIMQQQYRDWCRFNIDWKDNDQEKCLCYYDYCDNVIRYPTYEFLRSQGTVYAESMERIKEFIDKVGEDDFKKYILEVEE